MGSQGGGRITPVILAGGSGSRLWPLSGEDRPKQFQPLIGDRSLFGETLLRVADPGRFTAPLIVGNARHAGLLEAEIAASGVEPVMVVLEPEARNTAPAVTLAAILCRARGFDEVILVLPSDHAIGDPERLLAAIDAARPAAALGRLVTFGVPPAGPETGYGYIRPGARLAETSRNTEGVFHVERFVEKPALREAEAMLAEGGWLWNSGMFLFPVEALLGEVKRLRPATLEACLQALAAARIDGRVLRPEPAAFARTEALAIDHAVLERTGLAAVVPVDPNWSDVGSWSSVWQIAGHDPSGNVAVGEVMLHDVEGSYVRSEGPLTVVVGLADVIVVNTGEAVIVAARSRAQDVRAIAEAVRRRRPVG